MFLIEPLEAIEESVSGSISVFFIRLWLAKPIPMMAQSSNSIEFALKEVFFLIRVGRGAVLFAGA